MIFVYSDIVISNGRFKIKLLSAIAPAFPDPVFIFNSDGVILERYGGNEKKLYYPARFVKGQSLKKIIKNRKLYDLFMVAIQKAIVEETMVTFEYRMSQKDLSFKVESGPPGIQWFEGRIKKIPQKVGGKVAVVAVLVNITQRKLLEKQFKRMSETDPLTGAYNRRYFIEKIEYQFKYFLRYKNANSLIMFDIDHFKKVNDAYGHLVGDEVLKAFVRICKTNFRDTDIFARYGGEEFVALLPKSPPEGSYLIAERIRKKLDKFPMTLGKKKVHFTVSAGISMMQDRDNSFNDVLNRADKAMYRAKRNGRNQVVLFEKK